MKPDDFLNSVIGSWRGVCRTWLKPDGPADESPVDGEFEMMPNTSVVRHRYRGSLMGKAREGEELIAFNPAAGTFQTSWCDSFHMNAGILFAEGRATANGFEVFGQYAVGGGHPAWGWKTTFALLDTDQLLITAWNVSPEGHEDRAIETAYRRY